MFRKTEKETDDDIDEMDLLIESIQTGKQIERSVAPPDRSTSPEILKQTERFICSVPLITAPRHTHNHFKKGYVKKIDLDNELNDNTPIRRSNSP
jgi:hypothetical protein